MQKEVIVLQGEPFRFKVNAEWDSDSATYFTRELYRYAESGKISFELNTRKGSLVTQFTITIIEGVLSAVLYDLIKIIYNRLRSNREKERFVKPVYIFTEKEEFVITGDKDSKIPEELKKELFGE